MASVWRVLALALTGLLIVSMVVYAFVHLPEGDPALELIGDPPWLDDLRALDSDLADRPLVVRYFIWLRRVVRYVVRGAALTGVGEAGHRIPSSNLNAH
jgi:ABC-type dipeptide/oligopeptide/nickel transport system permease component